MSMADHFRIKRNFTEYAPPTSPEHSLLNASSKRQPNEVIGERLFAVTEHFMCWVIASERNPQQHRDILRNLESILQVCSVTLTGKFMTGLEETHAMGLLSNLIEGLENGKEHWEDIVPATELMLIQLERNPKSHIVILLVALRHSFHDHHKLNESLMLRKTLVQQADGFRGLRNISESDQEDSISRKLKTLNDYLIVRLTPEMSRELAQTIASQLSTFVQKENWDLTDLESLEQRMIQLFTPPEGFKG